VAAGKLPLVADQQRREALAHLRHRIQAHLPRPVLEFTYRSSSAAGPRWNSGVTSSTHAVLCVVLPWKMVEIRRWPKAVVERVVDRAGGDPQARRGGARSMSHVGLQALVLLVRSPRRRAPGFRRKALDESSATQAASSSASAVLPP